MVVAARNPMSVVLDDQRTEWVHQYRHDHPWAELWTRGLRRGPHSMETQERVFRMAEQLARRGIDRTDLFVALEEADRCVALSTDPHGASEAGYHLISTLVPLGPQSLIICADADEDEPELRAHGFDPVAFDGHDPAAYAWVMFELSARADADRHSRWRRCAPQAFDTPTAMGLARL